VKELLQKYLIQFKKLRVDRSHGIAPHKPVLLLSILQAYKQKLYTSNRIYITPELVALFKSTWNLIVTTSHDCRISYPFYYLKSDKFWALIPKEGFENLELLSSIAKSFNNLNAAIECAVLEEDLFKLMDNEYSNNILTQFLLDEYFPKAISFNKKGIKNEYLIIEGIKNRILNESSEEYRKEIQKLILQNNEEELFLRGSIFKREIPKIYNNACCISGMRIDSIQNVSMIDACHIIPFSTSYDDTVTNGISLCPNLHRAFDRGLISIGSKYEVLISNTFNEESSEYMIKKFAGSKISLPEIKDYWPLIDNLRWHNMNVFKK
jgi:putative restriction endonuclease